jgi:hypothetical protein
MFPKPEPLPAHEFLKMLATVNRFFDVVGCDVMWSNNIDILTSMRAANLFKKHLQCGFSSSKNGEVSRLNGITGKN